eukprot:NODE_8_length_66115_cov_0.981823.p46 type:complete len:148 gc:universal NODE_8_length_66115_cov_0.981823:18675-18232(-)
MNKFQDTNVGLDCTNMISEMSAGNLSQWNRSTELTGNFLAFGLLTSERVPLNRVKNGICPICERKFKDNSTALRHFKNTHCCPTNCPFSCSKKLRLFGRPDILRNHLMKCMAYRATNPNLGEDLFKEKAKKDSKLFYDSLYKEKCRR